MQIVGNLLNGRLAGEGNMMRHLAQLTYKLHYIQDPLSDFDFSLNSLSSELRDGLRLCKLAQVLTGWSNTSDYTAFACTLQFPVPQLFLMH